MPIKSRDFFFFRGFFVGPYQFIKYLHSEVFYCKKCEGLEY